MEENSYKPTLPRDTCVLIVVPKNMLCQIDTVTFFTTLLYFTLGHWNEVMASVRPQLAPYLCVRYTWLVWLFFFIGLLCWIGPSQREV